MTRLRAGSVKAGWTRVAFGDMVRQVKDRVDPVKAGLERYVAGEHMDTDGLRIRRYSRAVHSAINRWRSNFNQNRAFGACE